MLLQAGDLVSEIKAFLRKPQSGLYLLALFSLPISNVLCFK